MWLYREPVMMHAEEGASHIHQICFSVIVAPKQKHVVAVCLFATLKVADVKLRVDLLKHLQGFVTINNLEHVVLVVAAVTESLDKSIVNQDVPPIPKASFVSAFRGDVNTKVTI